MYTVRLIEAKIQCTEHNTYTSYEISSLRVFHMDALYTSYISVCLCFEYGHIHIYRFIVYLYVIFSVFVKWSTMSIHLYFSVKMCDVPEGELGKGKGCSCFYSKVYRSMNCNAQQVREALNQ